MFMCPSDSDLLTINQVILNPNTGEYRAIEDDENNSEGILQDTIPLSRLLSNQNHYRFNTSSGRNRQSAISSFCNNDDSPFCRLRYITSINQLLGGQSRHKAAPYDTSASCQYYVYALRRILC